MKVITISLVLFLLNCTVFAQIRDSGSRWLIFEGRVVKIGKPPSVLCGVTAPYRLAKYEVLKVYEGSYLRKEIVVHHLFCQSSVLEDLSEGDRVLVMIDLRSPPAQISPDGEILKLGEKRRKYYAAKRVAKVTTCCDF
jgi:hypothetical protein